MLRITPSEIIQNRQFAVTINNSDSKPLALALKMIHQSKACTDSLFMEFFEKFLAQNPLCKKYIARGFALSNNGSSITKILSGYGLTFDGIDVVLKEKRISCNVFIKEEDLADFFLNAPLYQKRCCLIDPVVIQLLDEKTKQTVRETHVITLCFFKGIRKDTLAIFDCEGTRYDEDPIKKRFFGNRHLFIYQHLKVRQEKGGQCCHAFAINDSEQLMRNHYLAIRILCLQMPWVFSYIFGINRSFHELNLSSEEQNKKKKEVFEICIRKVL